MSIPSEVEIKKSRIRVNLGGVKIKVGGNPVAKNLRLRVKKISSIEKRLEKKKGRPNGPSFYLT